MIVKIIKPGAAKYAAQGWNKRGGCTQGTSVPSMAQQYNAKTASESRTKSSSDFCPKLRSRPVAWQLAERMAERDALQARIEARMRLANLQR